MPDLQDLGLLVRLIVGRCAATVQMSTVVLFVGAGLHVISGHSLQVSTMATRLSISLPQSWQWDSAAVFVWWLLRCGGCAVQSRRGVFFATRQ